MHAVCNIDRHLQWQVRFFGIICSRHKSLVDQNIDILGIVIVGFCALIGLATGQDFYLNVALAWALLSFIGTIALAKFLEGSSFDE